MWLFIQDNGAGAFKQGDWWSLVWTLQKCLVLSGFVSLLLIWHSLSNFIRKKKANR